jgi:uncharacterized repeat protein (TIGR03943 family)
MRRITAHHTDEAERATHGSRLTAHGSRLVAASPPLLFAALVAKLWLSGTLGYYVNGRTIWIVLAGAFLCCLIGAAAILLRREMTLSWRTVVFLIPLVAGLVVPARPLSVSSGQSSSLGALQLASHVSGGSAGDQFASWLSDLSAHPNVSWWTGRQATLIGFATYQSGLPRHSVIVGRYLVTCCVVDATLLGFPVQIAAGAAIPPNGAWVQATGVFGRGYWTDPSGQQYPLLENARLAPVSIPSSPYLSP